MCLSNIYILYLCCCSYFQGMFLAAVKQTKFWDWCTWSVLAAAQRHVQVDHSLFSHGNWCVLNREECPPSSMCVLWHGALSQMTHRLCHQSLFLCRKKSLRFWSKRPERGRRSGCPSGVLDLWSQQSHGIKVWGQECLILVVSRLKSAIYCTVSYTSL